MPQRTQVPAQLQLSRPASAQSTCSTSSSGSVSMPSSRHPEPHLCNLLSANAFESSPAGAAPISGNILWVWDPFNMSFYCLSGVLWPPSVLWTHTHTFPTRQITTMPPPHNHNAHITDVEDAEGASMSWRRRWKCSALPTTLQGHGSIFQHLSCRRNASIRHSCTLPTPPLTRRHRKCQNSQRVHGAQPPKRLSSLLGAPGAKGQPVTVRGGQGAPSPSKFLFFKSKTTSALPERASALPGDIAGDRARFCAQFQSRPPPGSLLRLPGKFEVTPWAASGGNAGIACLF